MKLNYRFLKLASFALVLSGLTLTSCGDDDDPIIGGGDGINVSDGVYFSAEGVDPVFSDILNSEKVGDDGFGTQDRSGYVGSYSFLEIGSYNLVEIKSKEVAATIGGTSEVKDDAASGCGYNEYTFVSTSEGGSAIEITESGMYRLIYDAIDGVMITQKIEVAGLMGSATEGGWGSDTQLEVKTAITSAGGVWESQDVILRPGEIKLRFNCRWGFVERHDDDSDGEPDGWSEEDGFEAFTNFGGTIDDLQEGASNIAFEDEGKYTVTVTWDPLDGFTFGVVRTGDAPNISFIPDEHEWAITGDATANGWADDDATNDPIGVDIDLNYSGYDSGSNTHTWVTNGSVTLTAGGLKFRTNDSWDENRGYNELMLTGDVDGLFDSGGNIGFDASTAGDYELTLTTSDDGVNYTADFSKQ